MIKSGINISIILLGLLVITVIMPAAAASDETTIAGVVSKLNPADNTIEIRAERIWNGETWTGVSVTFVTKEYITGTVPASAVFDKLSVSDPVQATFTGDEEDTVDWLCIGRVATGESTGKYLSDAFGDPKYIISPFFNNFQLTYNTFADCGSCSGAVCSANYADLSVSQGWEEKNYAYEYTIKTGERHVFTSPEGCESELSVTFISGEAAASKCRNYPAAAGTEPYSDFVINVVQKGTVSDMTPVPAVTQTEAQTYATPVPTQSPGFMYIGALAGIFAAVLIVGNKRE